MDKLQKFEYVNTTEAYLENKQIYELFENLIKELVIHRPEQPLDFLIDKLSHKQPVRVFVMGPTGSQRKEIAMGISDQFKWKCISVGELLKKEIALQTREGQAIEESQKTHCYVDDQIIIELVKKEILQNEREHQSWIIEGFPRTKVQALSLQKIGVIPDKFILLENSLPQIQAKIKQNLLSQREYAWNGSQLDEIIDLAVSEYEMNIKGVKDAFKGFIYNYKMDGKEKSQAISELHRLLKLHFKPNAPRRPPRVLILGPPGSGRSTQAKAIAQRYGLVHVCCRSLLRAEIQRNPDAGHLITRCLDAGAMVPDSLVCTLVEQRLRMSDCRINGWVLDGFPQTEQQINLLKTIKIQPSLVCLFEQSDEESIRRLLKRRVDPETGIAYNLEIDPPTDPIVADRVVHVNEDQESVIRNRLTTWNQQISNVEEAFKNTVMCIQSDKPISQITEIIADAIQNPLF